MSVPRIDIHDVWAHVGIVSKGKNRAPYATVVSSLQSRTGADIAQVRQVITEAERQGFIRHEGNYLETPQSE